MSQAKQEIRLLSARDGIKNTPCFICLKQSHPDAFTRPRAGLCRSSEQIGKQHKRSGGEVPAGCHNTLVCRRTSAARSPCLISLRSPLLFSPSCSCSHFTSITRSFCCLCHLLSFILSFPSSVPDTLSLSASWPVFLSLLGLPSPPPHHTSASSFTFKYVLVGCESCSGGRSDCVFLCVHT